MIFKSKKKLLLDKLSEDSNKLEETKKMVFELKRNVELLTVDFKEVETELINYKTQYDELLIYTKELESILERHNIIV